MESQKLLDLVLKAISDRHGEQTQAYDMRGISILTDYYVVTSAGSQRQLHAIANQIIQTLHENHETNYRIEGSHDSSWLLVDLNDVVVDLFTQEARQFYGVEKLWESGKRLEIEEAQEQ